MRAVLTRVKSASVTIDGEVTGKIGQGFLILLGVGPEDTEAHCKYLAEKALGLRVFEDENEKMNLSLTDVGGQVLVVSQFTLYGNCRKGRRPSFAGAAGPELGNRLYEQFLAECEKPVILRSLRRRISFVTPEILRLRLRSAQDDSYEDKL